MRIKKVLLTLFILSFLLIPLLSSVAAKESFYIDENYIYHNENKNINLLDENVNIAKLSIGINNDNFQKLRQALLNNEYSDLIERLEGRFILEVENHGYLWYLNPKDLNLYYIDLSNYKYSLNKILNKKDNNIAINQSSSDQVKVKQEKNINLDPNVEELLKLVNDERAKYSLKPYVYDENLSLVALDKAKDMYENKYFAHISPKGISPGQRLNMLNYRDWRKMGENLAINYENKSLSPKEVFRLWMQSPGHRANILNPDFEYIGIAFYKNYVVQEFVKK